MNFDTSTPEKPLDILLFMKANLSE